MSNRIRGLLTQVGWRHRRVESGAAARRVFVATPGRSLGTRDTAASLPSARRARMAVDPSLTVPIATLYV